MWNTSFDYSLTYLWTSCFVYSIVLTYSLFLKSIYLYNDILAVFRCSTLSTAFGYFFYSCCFLGFAFQFTREHEAYECDEKSNKHQTSDSYQIISSLFELKFLVILGGSSWRSFPRVFVVIVKLTLRIWKEGVVFVTTWITRYKSVIRWNLLIFFWLSCAIITI